MTTPKKPDKPATTRVSFRHDVDIMDKIVGYAFATRRTTTDILREAINEYYERHQATIDRRQV